MTRCAYCDTRWWKHWFENWRLGPPYHRWIRPPRPMAGFWRA